MQIICFAKDKIAVNIFRVENAFGLKFETKFDSFKILQKYILKPLYYHGVAFFTITFLPLKNLRFFEKVSSLNFSTASKLLFLLGGVALRKIAQARSKNWMMEHISSTFHILVSRASIKVQVDDKLHNFAKTCKKDNQGCFRMKYSIKFVTSE